MIFVSVIARILKPLQEWRREKRLRPLDGTDGYQMPSDHWMAKARAALANTKGDRMIRDQVAQFISGKGPWVARCASDKDANWPFWFIADATGLNVLDHYPNSVLGKFLPKGICQELAEIMNGRPE